MQKDQKHRIWPALTEELYVDLCNMATEEKRTPSEMGAIFIENGIKERKRRRKGAKEDQAGNNAG